MLNLVCRKCKSRGQCYERREETDGGTEIVCMLCSWVQARLDRQGNPDSGAEPLLSTREYILAEIQDRGKQNRALSVPEGTYD